MNFVHEFKPAFSEAGLFAHPELLEEVTKINKGIHELAPGLDSPNVKDAVTVKSSDEKVPIDVMVKRGDGAMYLFAVSMRDAPTKASRNVFAGHRRACPRGWGLRPKAVWRAAGAAIPSRGRHPDVRSRSEVSWGEMGRDDEYGLAHRPARHGRVPRCQPPIRRVGRSGNRC